MRHPEKRQCGGMRWWLPWLLLLLVAPPGCGLVGESGAGERSGRVQAETARLDVLATVNGAVITQANLNLWLAGGHGGKTTPAMRKEALERLIEIELFYQKGKELGLDTDVKYLENVRRMQARTEAFKRKEMRRRVYNSEIAAKISIREDQARRYYYQHARELSSELHLASLRFPDLAGAKRARDRIEHGLPFEELARELYPTLPERERNSSWDLGFLPWQGIPHEWQGHVNTLAPGEVSQVLQGESTGIRIFKLFEKRDIPMPDFDRMKGAIMNRLRDEQMGAARGNYVKLLRSKAKIVKLKRAK